MVITVQNVVKHYNEITAVDDVSFQVKEGEIFGIIGPNGAGKTTIIEIMEGLREVSSGTVEVLGLAPFKKRKKLYGQIGVQLQETSYSEKVKVEELCKLFTSFYDQPKSYEELLKEFGILDKRKSFVSKLSGGQRQKLSVVLALIADPKIVFLDELTTGLDPRSRRNMWETIRGLKARGITVVLTTHFMDEAEYLCDRLGIMNKGKLVALDTVSNLINDLSISETVILEVMLTSDQLEAIEKIKGIHKVVYEDGQLMLKGKSSTLVLDLLTLLNNQGVVYQNLSTKKASLEDVFLQVTGDMYDQKGVE